MSATDELRRLLDERDIETSHGSPVIWKCANGHGACARDYDGALTVQTVMTPQQAVEATLGRGTCHIVKTWSDSDYVDGWRYRCSECWCFIPVNERDLETGDVISAANYCPNCGARVVGK